MSPPPQFPSTEKGAELSKSVIDTFDIIIRGLETLFKQPVQKVYFVWNYLYLQPE